MAGNHHHAAGFAQALAQAFGQLAQGAANVDGVVAFAVFHQAVAVAQFDVFITQFF